MAKQIFCGDSSQTACECTDNRDFSGEWNEADELSWALLDGLIGAEELARFESLCLADHAAIRRYVSIVEMHLGLLEHFAPAGVPWSFPSEEFPAGTPTPDGAFRRASAEA